MVGERDLYDLLYVPGGIGSGAASLDEGMLSLIRRHYEAGKVVASNCSGVGILARSGILGNNPVTCVAAVAPGLRAGFLLAPDEALFERLSAAIRAQSYAPPTLGALVATHWIEDGEADAIAAEIGAEVSVRTALAQARLGARLPDVVEPRCPHLWLPMAELEAERLVARALRAGVQLTPAEAPIVDPTSIGGVRLCVGAPSSRDQVETALARLATLLDSPQASPDMGLV